MKFVSFVCNGKNSYGVLGSNEKILDLSPYLGARYADLKSLLAGNGVDEAAAVANTNAAALSLQDVTLLPPIPNPGTIWCAGMNTYSHFNEVKELMNRLAPAPQWTKYRRSRFCSCVAPPA